MVERTWQQGGPHAQASRAGIPSQYFPQPAGRHGTPNIFLLFSASRPPQMLLALHPAKLLVSAIAAALLQHAKVGTDSPQFKYWAQFTKLSEKKLRGRWMWEQVAREELLPQLLAWVAVPAC